MEGEEWVKERSVVEVCEVGGGWMEVGDGGEGRVGGGDVDDEVVGWEVGVEVGEEVKGVEIEGDEEEVVGWVERGGVKGEGGMMLTVGVRVSWVVTVGRV
ncbi:hypothetical protein, partial [Corynebacterium glyciniphilum]|uniref:hypothetical protein n=1 Tax=Corynebacterium glyciniphilum TaxID=1404244 RepID=UPI0011AB68DE